MIFNRMDACAMRKKTVCVCVWLVGGDHKEPLLAEQSVPVPSPQLSFVHPLCLRLMAGKISLTVRVLPLSYLLLLRCPSTAR